MICKPVPQRDEIQETRYFVACVPLPLLAVSAVHVRVQANISRSFIVIVLGHNMRARVSQAIESVSRGLPFYDHADKHRDHA